MPRRFKKHQRLLKTNATAKQKMPQISNADVVDDGKGEKLMALPRAHNRNPKF